MIIKRKESFTKDFRQKHSLKFHMSAILVATALSGVLASKMFLVFKIENVVVRYPLAVVIAYLVFFLCIKLWLWYVAPARTKDSKWSDWLDIPTPSSSGSGGGRAQRGRVYISQICGRDTLGLMLPRKRKFETEGME